MRPQTAVLSVRTARTVGNADVKFLLTRFRRIGWGSGLEKLMTFSSEDFCPISENLFGRLYRSSPEGITILTQTMPPSARAMLAYYCSRRVHLEDLGLAIAGTCSAEDLYDVAGRAGWDLFARAEAAELPQTRKLKSRHGVTLATGTF